MGDLALKVGPLTRPVHVLEELLCRVAQAPVHDVQPGAEQGLQVGAQSDPAPLKELSVHVVKRSLLGQQQDVGQGGVLDTDKQADREGC